MVAKKKSAKKAVAKKKVAKKSVKGSIAVRVSRFGHDAVLVSVPTGSKVSDVLTKARIKLSEGEKVFIDGGDAKESSKVSNGDVVSVVTPKSAGNK